MWFFIRILKQVNLLVLNNSQTDFEGCYIANESFKMLLFSNFDTFIEISKRTAENSSFFSL